MSLARSIGYAILRGLAPEVMSVNEIINIARRAGGGYMRQQMVDDLRMFRGRLKYQTQIEALAPNQVVPRAWMSETKLGRPYKYRVFYSATMIDEETGVSIPQTFSTYEDDYKVTGGYETAFEDAYKGKYREEGQILTDVKVISHEHNRGYSY